MDSQHRHELKENTLHEFFVNFNLKEWWGKHGNTVLVVLLLVVGSVAVIRLVSSTGQAARERDWADLSGATSPEGYAAVAETTRLPTVRSLALLRGSDLALERSVAPTPPIGEDPAVQTPLSPQQQQRTFEEAALRYQRIIQSDAHWLVKLNAQLGLASVAEARGDLEEARRLYSDIEARSAQAPAIAAQARGRLALLPRLARPVILVDAPPIQEPSTLLEPGQSAPDATAGDDQPQPQPQQDDALPDTP
jgi:hypothetical protein